MRVGRDFFALQLRFATRAAAIAGVPLETSLIDYTNFYIRFGLGRGYDPRHPDWQEFLAGLAGAADTLDWIWRFYRRRPDTGPTLAATAGCFGYERYPDGRLGLHFNNIEPAERSPLGPARAGARRAELAALVAEARRREPADAVVVGLSWLYNLPAYRRLFPDAYVASARAAPPRLRNMPLWGQFLDRTGGVRPAPAATLLNRVAAARHVDDLPGCFPLQPLAVTAPLAAFA